MPTRRKKYDWDAIEQEYRAGQITIREISKIYGPAVSTISERAARHGWERDLTEQVQKATAARLLTDTADNTNTDTNSVRTENDIIDRAADHNASVVKNHRALAANARERAVEILNQLAIEDVPITAKASVLRALSGAIKDIVTLERQAFNIDAESGRNDEKAVPLHERLGRLRRQAAISAAENVEELGPVNKPIAPPVAPPAKINGKARA